jgi:hypothetical protein
MDFLMIVGDVVLSSPIEFKTIISRVEIDVIILQGLPEPFYPYPYGELHLS